MDRKIFCGPSKPLIFHTCRWNYFAAVQRHRPDGEDGVSERQRDAEDAHQDPGGDLLHAQSFVEAHLPGVDGGASHGSSSERLRQTLPGKK